ncbi:ImmA/IrrE family metallo-endopeptidase [Magnetococcales bacterium HHB-1]
METQPKASGFTKRSIYKLGAKIAKQLNYAPNGDIVKAIDQAGGRIKYKDPWDFKEGDSGSVVIESRRNFTIFLSTYTSASRDRFTVAHELGHYVLHYLIPEKEEGKSLGRMVCTRAGTGRIEWEANWFAAGFLMPSELFKEAFREHSENLVNIADQFGVSYSAAEIRAKALGLIEDE